jgi:tetratricopeptide (TPR) repeat protein
MPERTRAPVRVFVSYAHENKPLWLELKKQLGPLRTGGAIEIWWDREILPGQDWSEEIADNLETAELVLLLVSDAFLDSDYISGVEMKRALERHAAGEAYVVWILLEPCHFRDAEFTRLQGLPEGLTPVDDGLGDERQRKRVWAEVVEAIADVVKTISIRKGASTAPSGTKSETDRPIREFPRRNRSFTGRDDILARIHRALQGGGAVAVTQPQESAQARQDPETAAVTGLGGIGKTQAAVEYCHRHAAGYRLVWWVNADSPATLTEDFQGLAERLRLPEAEAQDQKKMLAAVRRHLEGSGGWLLVFDNADRHDDILPYLPQRGSGAVLITSRDRGWPHGTARRLDLDLWSRAEATGYLARRLGRDDPGYGDLAAFLGDLPLAIEQAAAFMDATGRDAAGYLALSENVKARMLAEAAAPEEHRDGVWVTWEVSVEAAEAAHPAARDLLNLIAFLAPEDIPRALFADHAAVLPGRLRAAAEDGLGIERAVAALARFSLIGAEPDSLSVHRLVQTVTRARLPDPLPWADAAIALLQKAFPNVDPQPDDVRSWPACLRLRPHAETALAQAEDMATAPDPTGRLLNQLALYIKSRAEYAAAKPLYERAIAIAQAALGPDDPEVAIRVNNLGSVLQARGDLPGARACFERALKIDEAALGPDHANKAILVNNLGGVLQAQGDLPGARACFERALTIDEAALGPDHPNVARDVNNLGLVLQAQGDLPGARACYERALTIDEAALGPDHPNVAIRVNNLGSVLQDVGDLPGARARFERAVAIFEATLGPDHPRTQAARNKLAALPPEGGEDGRGRPG